MFQIVSTMKTVLEMNFPSQFASITSFLNVFNLGSFGLSCSVSFDFVDYLLFVTVIPGFIILILVLLHQRFTFEDLLEELVLMIIYIRSARQSKFYFYVLFFLYLPHFVISVIHYLQNVFL